MATLFQEPAAIMADRDMRVLTLSHMDPRLSNGGAELAARRFHQEIDFRPGFTGWFLACAPGKFQPRPGVVFGQPFGPRDYLYGLNAFDYFNHSNLDEEFAGALTTLLHDIAPDVVHLHHYTNFGVDVLRVIRAALPDARIVVTLHEYLAICNHFGQMVKRPSFNLCERSSPTACHGCFPEIPAPDFFMRELFVKRFFRLVDMFVSPSHFLAKRYIDWGIEPERITVIENGLPDLEERGQLPMPSFDGPLRVGFFGQISRLKGMDVAIEAARILEDRGETNIQIEVYGDYSSQPIEFQQRFEAQLADTPRTFFYAGPYENARVDQLMQAMHAVLVPSIWWENSPVVIEEALANRRPVIASDIGGMAEKVRDGIDGLQFQAGSPQALAALVRRVAADPKRLTDLQATMRRPRSTRETADQTIALYRSLWC